MSTQKFLREIRKAVADAGGFVSSVTMGKHIKVRVDFGRGPRLVTCSISPSDGHALDNVRRDIERIKMESQA